MTTPTPKTRRSQSTSRQRPRLAAVRLNEPEYEQLRAAAEENGTSVSAYLRDLVTRAVAV